MTPKQFHDKYGPTCSHEDCAVDNDPSCALSREMGVKLDREPIRCTTHHHACACREAEFERVRAENEELREYLRIIQGGADAFALLRKDDKEVSGEFKSLSETVEQALKGGKP